MCCDFWLMICVYYQYMNITLCSRESNTHIVSSQSKQKYSTSRIAFFFFLLPPPLPPPWAIGNPTALIQILSTTTVVMGATGTGSHLYIDHFFLIPTNGTHHQTNSYIRYGTSLSHFTGTSYIVLPVVTHSHRRDRIE